MFYKKERRKRAVNYHNEEKPEEKGEINMKNHYVSVEEEGKSPHRQLYK